MAARVHLLLPAIPLLLAGCTGGDSHGGHGEPALLLGIANELDRAIVANWTVTATNGSVVWEASAPVEPTKTAEKRLAYEGSGDHRIQVTWEGGAGNVTYDPSSCEALTHIVLTVAADGLSESKRECH